MINADSRLMFFRTAAPSGTFHTLFEFEGCGSAFGSGSFEKWQSWPNSAIFQNRRSHPHVIRPAPISQREASVSKNRAVI